MSARAPSSDWYDAHVGLDPNPRAHPSFAFAVVKLTYELRDGVVTLALAEPLMHDVFTDPDLDPKLPCGSDFWFEKRAADVLIRGSAFSRTGAPFQTHMVSATVGDRTKRIAVFGPRWVDWSPDGAPSFTPPEQIDNVPLLYQFAYGGLDDRVPIPAAQRDEYQRLLEAGLAADHPGLYPRNPVGMGYLAVPGPVKNLELPNLEDPSNLLTPERLCAGRPELWYQQPLPWCFEWLPVMLFPRSEYWGLDAWYPGPTGAELQEVARGYVPPNARALIQGDPSLRYLLLQEASLGMTFADRLAGKRISVVGMHPEGKPFDFVVPPPPQLELIIEGQRQPVEARLINAALMPNELRFTLTYAAKSWPFSRVFIPGIHRVIPAAVSVNGDKPVPYVAPVPVRDRLKGAAG